MSQEQKVVAFDKSVNDPVIEAAKVIDQKIASMKVYNKEEKTKISKDELDAYLTSGIAPK